MYELLPLAPRLLYACDLGPMLFYSIGLFFVQPTISQQKKPPEGGQKSATSS